MDLSLRWWQVPHTSIDPKLFIPKLCWPPNSPDLRPFDYSLWTELTNCIDWSQVTTKATVIDKIKRSVKRVEKEKILNYVSDFTVRL